MFDCESDISRMSLALCQYVYVEIGKGVCKCVLRNIIRCVHILLDQCRPTVYDAGSTLIHIGPTLLFAVLGKALKTRMCWKARHKTVPVTNKWLVDESSERWSAVVSGGQRWSATMIRREPNRDLNQSPVLVLALESMKKVTVYPNTITCGVMVWYPIVSEHLKPTYRKLHIIIAKRYT